MAQSERVLYFFPFFDLPPELRDMCYDATLRLEPKVQLGKHRGLTFSVDNAMTSHLHLVSHQFRHECQQRNVQARMHVRDGNSWTSGNGVPLLAVPFKIHALNMHMAISGNAFNHTPGGSCTYSSCDVLCETCLHHHTAGSIAQRQGGGMTTITMHLYVAQAAKSVSVLEAVIAHLPSLTCLDEINRMHIYQCSEHESWWKMSPSSNW